MNAPTLIQRIVKRDGSLVPYARERIVTAVHKALTANGRDDLSLAMKIVVKVEAALLDTYADGATPSVEDIQDVVERILMTNGLPDIAKSYIIYRHRRAMARAARAFTFEVSDSVPYRKIYEVLRWNMEHRCDSVPALNRIVSSGQLPDLIRAADLRYNEEVAAAALPILERAKEIRIVIIAGPSSSGKTTTMIKISEKLRSVGMRLKAMNLDNYFFDLEQHPIDEFGDRDYETPQALDLELINQHLVALLAGKTVATPHYNFKTGKRTLGAHDFTLQDNEMLMIDSLHGLYDRMTGSVAPHAKYKVYIETLGQFQSRDGSFMRWADNRLLRRMIRDKNHRNLGPIQTLTHWHYVRRSELQHIIPFIKHADAVVNSALPYELPFLKHRLFRYISSACNRFKGDPKRLDAHIRANRVHALLKPIKPVRDDTCIPTHSLLREFIGGSHYTY